MRFASLVGLGILTSAPALADPLFVAHDGTPSFSAAQCSSTTSDSSPVTDSTSCGAVGGTVSGSSFSSFGHLGVTAAASSASGSSLGNGIGSEAVFRDILTFSSTTPGATGADVRMSLFLRGIMDFAVGAGSAGDSIEGSVSFSGIAPSFFFFRFFDDPVSGFSIEQNPFTVTGTLGSTIAAKLTTPTFHVDFDSPTVMTLRLQSGASTGGTATASSRFGDSFFLADTPFEMPDGATVSAGSWLIDGHFFDPLAAVGLVPEPSSWAMMICGFGVLGFSCRRSRRRIGLAAA